MSSARSILICTVLRIILKITLCTALCAPLPALAAPATKTFDGTYALLKTRNIFDPQRQPGATEPAPVAAPVTQADYVALTGILVTDQKVLAFFSGSRTEFNAVLGPKGIIAGALITQITPGFIEIQREGKKISVAVGQTVPLDANSAPGAAPSPSGGSVAAPSAPSTPPSQPVTNVSAPASAASASPAGVDREAVMRRMMQKRQQELK